MGLCTCPVSAALASIPSQECASDFGQIQKIAFQRMHSAGVANGFTSAAKITLKASWTAKTAANDSSKIVVTPFVEAPTSDGGDAITYGGGNDTVGGVSRVVGRNPVNMTFALNQYLQSVISVLKQYQCETDLGVYLFNGDGQILAVKTGADTYAPIPIRSLFVGDWKLNGISNPDANVMSFSFNPNWSDNVEIVTPTDFNPLSDL